LKLKILILMTSSRLLRRLIRRFQRAHLLKRNKRNINSRIRVYLKLKNKTKEDVLSSQMEAGNALSAKTITLREERNAIGAKSQGLQRIFLENPLTWLRLKKNKK